MTMSEEWDNASTKGRYDIISFSRNSWVLRKNHEIHQSKYEQGTSRTLPPHQIVTSCIPPRISTTLCQSATDSNEITVAARDSPILMSFLILVVPI